MKILKLTTNGRLTIPAQLRKKYNIKPGTRIHFVDEDNGIKIIPVTIEMIRANIGFIGMHGKMLKSLQEEKKIEREL